MKTKINTLFFLVLSIILFAACSQNEDNNSSNSNEKFENAIYYEQEIVAPNFQNIYRSWSLKEINGGFSGDGYEPDFTHLKIVKFGKYAFVNGEKVVEFGKIEIVSNNLKESNNTIQNSENLVVKFIKDPESPNVFKALGKNLSVTITTNDELQINSECCDGYNYIFEDNNWIYADWELTEIKGGISGDGKGYKKDFTNLVLKENGNYYFKYDAKIIEFGQYKLVSYLNKKENPDLFYRITLIKDLNNSISPVQLNNFDKLPHNLEKNKSSSFITISQGYDGYSFSFVNKDHILK